MHFFAPVVPLFLLSSYVIAGDVDANDLPSQCQDVCAPVVSLTASCDKQTSEDDTAELKCICNDPKAASSLPMCDACITKYSKDGSDNDANDLVRSCSFTTTSYDATATGSMASTSATGSMKSTNETGAVPIHSPTSISSVGVTVTTTGTITSTGSDGTTTMTSTMTNVGAGRGGTPVGGSSTSASPTSTNGVMGNSIGVDTGLAGMIVGALAILGI